jgi:two-component system chemotaxis response regulator CheY
MTAMRRSLRFLVVDDHVAFRQLTMLRLQAYGCTCVGAGSVAAAIDALEREHFDVVLSDHSMPGPSGLDLLAYVRRRHLGTPFVLMSSFVDDAIRREALAGGAVGVYDKAELVDSLEPLLSAPLAA